jgi:hypothetical protein
MLTNVILTFFFFILVITALTWVNSIDYMKKKHSDYNGDDFLN